MHIKNFPIFFPEMKFGNEIISRILYIHKGGFFVKKKMEKKCNASDLMIERVCR